MFTDAYIATTAAERRASAAAQIRVKAMNLALRLPTDSTALADAKKIVASAGVIERYLMGKTARSRPVTKKKKK